MKRIIHLPGILLIGALGMFCSLIGWEAMDAWLSEVHADAIRKIYHGK